MTSAERIKAATARIRGYCSMPPEIEIERLEWKLAEIEAELGQSLSLTDLIRLCVLKHDGIESLARFRAMQAQSHHE